MKRPTITIDQVYHVYNRGVEKRKTFLNDKDYLRFIHDMYEFNDISPAANLGYHLLKSDFNRLKRPRKPLVEILCFVLMPNHYHFILRQRVDNGITEFMRKIGTGYTNYFNIKNDRVGPLFQGKFKIIHVSKEAHFLYLPHYIHLNPLDLITPEWREKKIETLKKALQFLNSYRWSSYLDYIGKKNYHSIIEPNFILSNYRSPTSINYRRDIEEWLRNLNLEPLRYVTFD